MFNKTIPSSPFGRILALDGLRALAILAVMLSHIEILKIGWVGVDLFFVLSGFLITQILRRDKDKPHYWKRFYLKRVARILPPVTILMLFVALAYRPPFVTFLPYIFFLGNFFALFKHRSPHLAMLWSLAVEEHFYLLFPIAVRYLSHRELSRMLWMIVILEPAVRLIATPFCADWQPIYFWTFFRLDGLALGALLALWTEDFQKTERLDRWSGKMALLLGFTFCVLIKTLPHLFGRGLNKVLFNSLGYSMLVAMFMFAVAYVVRHQSGKIAKILSSKPLVFVGSISYGLYLYHQQVMAWADHKYHSKIVATSVFLGFAVIISWLSFWLVESRCISMGHRAAARLWGGTEKDRGQLKTTEPR